MPNTALFKLAYSKSAKKKAVHGRFGCVPNELATLLEYALVLYQHAVQSLRIGDIEDWFLVYSVSM